jgi:uncharacterized protein DUF2855
MNCDTFLVNKNDFSQTQIDSQLEMAEQSLEKGEILLRVDQFAMTANNITYAAMGDALRYWEFFPAKSGWGIIPVWGFAEVVISDNENTKIGERYYGYFPMSTHLRVKPQQVSSSSFIDGANHRQPLSKIYNQYICCANDPLYQPETEALQMLLRPLFTTSFLLDDFLFDNDLFGARQLVLSSASSKTALGTAFSLYHNRSERQLDYRIIGLTSPGNLDFVKSLGCYDDVLSYDQATELAGNTATTIVDFAGNSSLLKQLHQHFNDHLKYSCLVGAAHWDKGGGSMRDLPGAPPQMFFAPFQAEKRLKEWGGKEFQHKLAGVWSRFVDFVDGWVEIEQGKGPVEVDQLYQKVLAGHLNPKTGNILSLWND